MFTLLAIIGVIFVVLLLIGIGLGLLAISPLLAIILLLPLIDLVVYKIYKAIKNRS